MFILNVFFVDEGQKVSNRYCYNKKVLLRERKRHTNRRVASTPYAVPVGGGGGRYLPWVGGGYLPWVGCTYPGWGVPTLGGGYLPWVGGTYPGQGVQVPPTWEGTPPIQTWEGRYPPPIQTQEGRYPPPVQTW